MRKAMWRNRLLAAAGILGFVGAVVGFDLGCPGGTTSLTDNDFGIPTSLSVYPNPVGVRVGGSTTLNVTVLDAKGREIENPTVTWSTTNPAIATVSGDANGGVVTGVSVGTASIKAQSGAAQGGSTVTVSEIPVASVTVSGSSTVAEFAATPFTATAKDAAGNILTGRTVTWSSSNSAIASVSSSGVVTGNQPGGPVTITATIELQTGTAPITVIGAPVAMVEVSAPTNAMQVGETSQFSARVRDAAAHLLDRTITWSSSNPAVASVSATGLVTALAVGGPVTITATCEGKSGSQPVTVTGATAFISGRVINYVNGQGIGGAAVSFLANDGIGSRLAGTAAAGDGSFTSPGLSTGLSSGILIEGSAAGFVTGRIVVGNVPNGATTYAGDVPLVPSSSQTGGISGQVKNARTAGGVSGASVSVFNNVTSNVIATQTTDGIGNFSFTGLAAGTYRLTASATGFQNAQRIGVAVGDGGVTANQDLVMSPSGTSAITIVLTWGASPSDLDSHLTGPNTDGSRFHVYYASRGSLTGAPFANLDVDDTQSYGPETVTILQMNAGTYRYSVHDFTNRNSNPSTGLGSSGAKVQVYTASGLAQTFSVPGGAGTLWTVFELSGTLASPVITPVNTMSYASNSAAIPAPPVGFGSTDASLIWTAIRQHPKGTR